MIRSGPCSSPAPQGLRPGDVLRALTGARMEMTYPTANLLLGGVGRPKLKRVALPATARPLLWVREAIRSNAQLQDPKASRPGDASVLLGARRRHHGR